MPEPRTAETDYAVAPGEYLAEWLEENGIERIDAARSGGFDPVRLDEILDHGAPLLPGEPGRLFLLTGIEERIWSRYECRYRADLQRLNRTESDEGPQQRS